MFGKKAATKKPSHMPSQTSEAYFDWASAAPVLPRAREAFMEALAADANPSSPHAAGVRAKAILEEARKKIARLAAVKTDGVIFTSGATEANALALRGHVNARLAAGKELKDLHLLYIPTAHSSVTDTMEALKSQGAQIEQIQITAGAIDLARLTAQLRPETVLVSIDAICGETGTAWATRDVRRVIDAYHRDHENITSRIILHVDASQAPLVESIDHNHLGADLITLDAQKVGGVRGIGALIRAHANQNLLPLSAILQGGGQEFGLRPGTESPALAAAFATALGEAEKGRGEFVLRASEARAQLLETLLTAFPEANTPQGFFVNSGKECAPHILNLSFPGRDTDYAVMLLSKAGYAISTKSACETDEIGSRVVFTLTGDEKRALSTLRISLGPSTNFRTLQNFAKELISVIRFLDAHVL
jgi:cysteine desulfurase